MQAKNDGEMQPADRSKLSTHADNLALVNPDPPEQQADMTTFRPREVVGPPTEVMARPTLAPRDQILRTNFQPYSRGQHAEIIPIYLRFGSHAGKQRPENVGAVVVCLLAIYEGSVRLCCRATFSSRLCAVYGSTDAIF